MKNIAIGLLTGVLLVGVVWYLTNPNMTQPVQKKTTVISPSISIAPSVTVSQKPIGGDTDDHGCFIAAGYGWCDVKQKCVRSFEESCDKPEVNDSQAIAQALAKKNGWDRFDNLDITISKNDGTYATGGVTEKGAEAGGGYWFAKKVSGIWEIVADGNGIILCSSLIPYPDYPRSLISSCYDEKKDTIVER